MVSLHEKAEISEMGYLGSDQRGLEAEDGMVVFGFGRDRGAVPLLKGRTRFVVGFYPFRIETPADHADFEDYLGKLLVGTSSGSSAWRSSVSRVSNPGGNH